VSNDVNTEIDALAARFDAVSLNQWREKVGDAAASGVPVTELEDRIAVPWLYTPGDALASDPGGFPAEAPFVRGDRIGGEWDIRQERSAASIEDFAAQAIEDLEGGATSTGVVFDDATRARVFSGSEFDALGGVGGLVASSVDELDRALADVQLDLAPVSLSAGASAVEAAAQLVALWQRRGHDLQTVGGSLGVDPIGAFARSGAAESDLPDAVARAGAFAAEADVLVGPDVTLLRADASVYGEAGASPALELALAVATATEYLRACEAAGLSPEKAAARIEIVLSVGADQFLEIARLRAVRRLWARVLELSGVPEEARRSKVVARTSARIFTGVDPWVNLLRGTTATFAAAVGGADSISVSSFDLQRGDASELGRRIARNTQLILMHESSLGHVGDPGGGSWYVEDLTDQVAAAAWSELTEVDGAGGVAQALLSGALREKIDASVAARREKVVTRKCELTGVNAFPLLGDDGFSDPATAVQAQRAAATDAAVEPSTDFATLVERAAAGASTGQLAAARGLAGRMTGEALPIQRESEPFEALRSAASGSGAKVFLACLGTNAEHNVAATWAANFFGAGGIESVQSEPVLDAATAGDAFAGSGATIAAICAGKTAEADQIAAAVAGLKSAGATKVYLAPGSADAADAAGADLGVKDGVDMGQVLADALAACGVSTGGAA
jgi:methylmalonyl-CoA mutase